MSLLQLLGRQVPDGLVDHRHQLLHLVELQQFIHLNLRHVQTQVFPIVLFVDDQVKTFPSTHPPENGTMHIEVSQELITRWQFSLHPLEIHLIYFSLTDPLVKNKCLWLTG